MLTLAKNAGAGEPGGKRDEELSGFVASGLLSGADRARLYRVAAAAVDRWNTCYPIGTPVRYWPGLKAGPGIASVTRSRAYLIGLHTAVVCVEDRPDCIALSHVAWWG